MVLCLIMWYCKGVIINVKNLKNYKMLYIEMIALHN